MKYKCFTLLVFVALPAIAAAPRTFVSSCDVQMQISDGRDVEGLTIPGQRAEFILPCVTKEELARIAEAFGKGDAERLDCQNIPNYAQNPQAKASTRRKFVQRLFTPVDIRQSV